MKALLARLLNFLRLTDENGVLSLTHIAVMVVIVKVGVAKNISMADLGALLIALLHYTGKKVLAHVQDRADADDTTADHVEALDAVTVAVKKLEERAKAEDSGRALTNAMGKR